MNEKLTVLEAFEKLYDKSGLGRRAQQSFDLTLRQFAELTGNPTIDEIDDELLAKWRQACLDRGPAAATINNRWGHIRALLRRVGPQFTGNPRGLGLISRVPWMRPVKRQHKRPYRIPLTDLSRFYVAAKFAQFPRIGIAPADWWRCLVVISYTTGLRRSDLFAIRFADIDLQAGTLDVTPQKTGKCDLFHLHEVAVRHIERVARPGEWLFARAFNRGGRFSKLWHFILGQAKVDRPFTLHDIRRTAASEIDRVERGLGKVFLQHAPRGVSEVSYLNASEELGDAIDRMRLPDGFRAGVKMAERADQRAAADRVEFQADEFHAPVGPDRRDWKFAPGKVWFRGRWFRFAGKRAELLRALATSKTPLGVPEVIAVMWGDDRDPQDEHVRWRCQVEISQLRSRLKAAFGLPPEWDCIPNVERGRGGCWTLHMPPWLTFDAPVMLAAAELRTARERAGWKQSELARRLGVSKSSVCMWETGKQTIPDGQARRLIGVLSPYLDGRATA